MNAGSDGIRDDGAKDDDNVAGTGRSRRPAGRPARTSREEIIDTVLQLGFDQASVTSVARRIGVDPSTLYGHVRNREDMLAAAADAALERMRHPEGVAVGWRDYLESATDGLWELFLQYPGLAAHLRSMQSTPPALFDRSAQVVQTLRESFHIDLHEAALVVDTIADSVTDSFLTLAQLEAPSPADPQGPPQREIALSALTGPNAVVHADYAHVLRNAISTADPPSDWWKQKVHLILDGLAYRLQADQATTSGVCPEKDASGAESD